MGKKKNEKVSAELVISKCAKNRLKVNGNYFYLSSYHKIQLYFNQTISFKVGNERISADHFYIFLSKPKMEAASSALSLDLL